MPVALTECMVDVFSRIASQINAPIDQLDDTFEARLGRFRERQGFAPHDGQCRIIEAIWNAKRGGPREIWVAAGKRGGKSVTAADSAADEFHLDPAAKIWVASGSYEMSENVYGQVERALPSSLRTSSRSSSTPMFRRFVGGGFLKSRSWKETEALEVDGLDGVVCDEAQSLDMERWKLLRARVLDKRGWLLFIGSPDTTSEFFNDMTEQQADWKILIGFPTSMNPRPEVQAALEEERRILPEDDFAQLYEGKPRKLGGIIFQEFELGTHVKRLEFDPTRPVELVVDPGVGWYAVVAAQVEGRNVNFFDEVYMENTSDQAVITECGFREWWPKVTGGVIDIAARAKSVEAATSTLENWRTYAHLGLRSQYIPLDAGIMRLRTFLKDPHSGFPRIFFDPKCEKTIREFALYRRGPSGNIIDSNNHAIKAICYGLVDRFGFVERATERIKPVVGGMRWVSA